MWWLCARLAFYVAALTATAALLLWLVFRLRSALTRVPRSVAFFHPYSNDCAGGERVLWCAVRSVQDAYPELGIFIYTGAEDGVTKQTILAKAQNRFGIELREEGIQFVFLPRRRLLEPSLYPRFTMLFQSLGSIVFGLGALWAMAPVAVVDTMGYAFTYPVFSWLGGCRLGAYVHYPTISTDMLSRVAERRPQYNNNSAVAASGFLSAVKVVYYKLFAIAYGFVGSRASVVMTNSTWTNGHVSAIFSVPSSALSIVYPPCDTAHLESYALSPRENTIVSVGQFRPEKAHDLQLDAFKLLKEMPGTPSDTKLLLIGSVRDDGDRERQERLAARVKAEKIDNVEFGISVPYSELCGALSRSKVGLHTMWNEHFGIAVVEYQAAGAIPVAHNSGGPRSDIISHGKTGFLATDAQEYAECMHTVLTMSESEYEAVAGKGRADAARFSEQAFDESFKASIAPLIGDM